MGRLFIILISTFCFASFAYSQTDSVYYGTKAPDSKKQREKKEQPWKDRVTYGGNFQVMYYNGAQLYLSPNIGYIPFKKFNAGIGATYVYASDYSFGRRQQSLYGGHIFARYQALPNLSIVSQHDRLYQPDWLSLTPGKKAWVGYTWLGLAYTQEVGDKLMFYESLMYNVTPHPLSIYNRLIFQFGFTAKI